MSDYKPDPIPHGDPYGEGSLMPPPPEMGQRVPLPPPPEEPKQKDTRARVLIGIGAAVLGLMVGMIGGSDPTTISATAPTVTKTVVEPGPTVTVDAPDPSPANPAPDPSGDPGVIPFGKTWEWVDGLQVKVGEPVTYRPSNTAFGGDGYDHAVILTVTLTNKTGSRFDPLFTTNLSSGGREGDQIFDSAKDVGGGPEASLRDGKSITFKIAYGVNDVNDIELEVSPDFTHDSAIFSTSP